MTPKEADRVHLCTSLLIKVNNVSAASRDIEGVGTIDFIERGRAHVHTCTGGHDAR